MLKKIYTFGFVVLINTISSFAQDPVMAIYERMDRLLEHKNSDNTNILSAFPDAAEIVHVVLGLQLPERYSEKLKVKKASATQITKYPTRQSTRAENVSGLMDYLKSAYMLSVGYVESFLYLCDYSLGGLEPKERKKFERLKEYYDIRGLQRTAAMQVKNKRLDSLTKGHLDIALKFYDFAAVHALSTINLLELKGLNSLTTEMFAKIEEHQSKGETDSAESLIKPTNEKVQELKKMTLEVKKLQARIDELKLDPALQMDYTKSKKYREWLRHLSDKFERASKKAGASKNMTLEISSKKAPNADIAKEDIARFKNFYKNAKGVKKVNVAGSTKAQKHRFKGGKRSAAGNNMQLYKDIISDATDNSQDLKNYVYNAEKLVLQTSDLRKLTKTKKLTLEVYKPGKDITIKLPKNIINLELIFFVKDKDFAFEDYEKMIKNIFKDKEIMSSVEFGMKFPNMKNYPLAMFQSTFHNKNGYIVADASPVINIYWW